MNFNREIRSSLFIDYFGRDEVVGRENFLSLYNAIHGTSLSLEDTELKLTNIDNTAYMTFQNDLGMIVNGSLVVLMEHQSTVNPNMPLRILEYVTKIYSELTDSRERYSTKLVQIPTPEFYVFYNGKKDLPKEFTLKLSDSFMKKAEHPTLELEVNVYNINDKDLQLRRKCDKLDQYSSFLEFFLSTADLKNSASCSRAILDARKLGLLPNYLDRKIKEIHNMFLAEYDYNEDIAVKKEEAYEDGVNDSSVEKAISVMDGLNLSLEDTVKLMKLNSTQVSMLNQKLQDHKGETVFYGSPKGDSEGLNLFTAEYDYNKDIAIKKEEAYEDGVTAGRNKEAVEKAIAVMENLHVSREDVIKILGLTEEQIKMLDEELLQQDVK